MDDSYVGKSMIDMYNTSSVASSSFNTSSASGFGGPMLRPQISQDTLEKIDRMRTLLNMKLGPEHLAQRQGAGGSKLTYIEGWRVINLANEVFGFNGWSTEIKQLEVDFIDADPESGKWNMGVTALVRVSLKDGCSREDIGYGKAENVKSKGDSLDKCKKEAVTDATKRALRTFGNLLGNCLYDKAYLADVSKMKSSKPKFDCNELHRATPMYPAASPAPTNHASTSSASILPSDMSNNNLAVPSTSTPQQPRKGPPPPVAGAKPASAPIPRPAQPRPQQGQGQNPPSAVPARLQQSNAQSHGHLNAQKPATPVRPETAQSAAYFSDMDESLLDGIELDAAQYEAESSPKGAQQAPPRDMPSAQNPAASRAPSAVSAPQRQQNAPSAPNARPKPAQPQQANRAPQQQPSRPNQQQYRPNQPAQRPPLSIDQSRSAPVTNAQARQRAIPGGTLPSVNVATGRNAPESTNIEDVIAIGAKAAPELGHFAGGGFASARGVKRMAGEGDENQPNEGQLPSPARKGNVVDEGNKRPRMSN